ncbi:hypothetical protein ACKKBG_A04695 [Auxenochlorella protothecoides x Auxenochlorella symbiontica]
MLYQSNSMALGEETSGRRASLQSLCRIWGFVKHKRLLCIVYLKRLPRNGVYAVDPHTGRSECDIDMQTDP